MIPTESSPQAHDQMAGMQQSPVKESPGLRMAAAATALLLPALMGTSCEQRVAIDDYPPNSLRVRFVAADRYTDCLIASAVMCANYVLDSPRFSQAEVRDEMASAGLDGARIGDLKAWLESQGVSVVPLKGNLSGDQPTGLGWWLLVRGYPVICVVNKFAGNAEYNHAVLVIGIEMDDATGEPRSWYILDPASPRRIEHWDRLMFEHYWGSGMNVMLPLFEAPPEAAAPTTAGVSL